MRKLLPLLCIVNTLFAGAQDPVFDTINANNISARFASNGAISWDGNEGYFYIPKDSVINALYAAALWIGGFNDATQELHNSSMRYGAIGSNFGYGPIANAYDSLYVRRYNQLWKVKQQQINNHKLNYSNAAYAPPKGIAQWPGNGNTANGEPLLLAPFEDLNGNYIYEPHLGETPVIRGDEAIYIIYSDRDNPNDSMYGKPLNVDIHLMAYAYASPGNVGAYNSLFLHYNIVNRTNSSYSDVLISHWNDFELGCFSNDRIGCDTNTNSFYVYNAIANDINCQGVKGYGTMRPALGVTFLNSPLYSNVVYNNYSTSGTSPLVKLDNARKLYDLINAKWADGTPLTYGGNGHLGDVETKFHILENPCDTLIWKNYYPAGPALPAGDNKAIGTAGKFFLPGNSNLCVDIAYIFATGNPQATCTFDVVDSLKERINQIHTIYNTSLNACPSFKTNVSTPIVNAIRVYPNPAQDYLVVEFNGLNIQKLMISDVNGKVVYNQTVENDITHIIQTRHLQRGFYILSAQTPGGLLMQKLIIN